MSKRKQAIFLNTYTDEKNQRSFNATVIHSSIVNGLPVEVEKQNTLSNLMHPANRKAKRIVASRRRKRK